MPGRMMDDCDSEDEYFDQFKIGQLLKCKYYDGSREGPPATTTVVLIYIDYNDLRCTWAVSDDLDAPPVKRLSDLNSSFKWEWTYAEDLEPYDEVPPKFASIEEADAWLEAQAH